MKKSKKKPTRPQPKTNRQGEVIEIYGTFVPSKNLKKVKGEVKGRLKLK